MQAHAPFMSYGSVEETISPTTRIDSQFGLVGFLIMSCALGVMSHALWASADLRTITGSVQNQDLRRVDQAIVQVRDQEGNVVAQGVTNQAGEFSVIVPEKGIYSVSAIQETYRSEYAVVTIGKEKPAPVTLTLSLTKEIALEIVSPLQPIQYKAASETYQLSRKDIEMLPRGNNNTVQDVLATIPSIVIQPLNQFNIRQDHANQQFRIDGVPIPEGVSS